MNCSILGCGWLGYPLAVFLMDQGMKVKGSSTRQEKLEFLTNQGIDPYLVRLFPDKIEGDIEGFLESEVLILNFPPGRHDGDVSEAFPGTMANLLKAVKDSPVKKLIFISSTSVYADDSGARVTEDTPPQPDRASGAALLEVEKMLQDTGLPLTILRMGGLVGYNRKPGRFLAGRKGLTEGEAPVNLVHQDDCILVIYEIISQDYWGDVFNVVSDLHPRRRDFYTYAARKMGLEEPTFITDDSPAGKLVSNRKIKRNLQYEFRFADPFEMVE